MFACFNGSTARSPWYDGYAAVIGSSDCSFNGSTARSPWYEPYGIGYQHGVGGLQWVHGSLAVV